MRTRYRTDRLAQSRSRLAFWVITTASLLGVLGWFLVMNRSSVSVVLPFGFGTWVSPLSLVILTSMFLGSASTLILQALFAARRCVKALYKRWNQPRGDQAHAADVPHIVSIYAQSQPPMRALVKEINHND